MSFVLCACACVCVWMCLCVYSPIKWNAFSFSDWKSNRQWFLSQSAYINPIKLSVGKAVRRLYAWCTLNFDLMTSNKRERERDRDVDWWRRLTFRSVFLCLCFVLFFSCFSVTQQQNSRKYISRLIQSRSRRRVLQRFLNGGMYFFWFNCTHTHAFCYDLDEDALCHIMHVTPKHVCQIIFDTLLI